MKPTTIMLAVLTVAAITTLASGCGPKQSPMPAPQTQKVTNDSRPPEPVIPQPGGAGLTPGNVYPGAPFGGPGSRFGSANLTQEQINETIEQRRQAGGQLWGGPMFGGDNLTQEQFNELLEQRRKAGERFFNPAFGSGNLTDSGPD